MSHQFLLRSVLFIVLTAATNIAHTQPLVDIPRVPTSSVQMPVVVVPQGTSTTSLQNYQNVPVVVVPAGPVMLVPVPPPVKAERSYPDCTVAEERCASLCYPLPEGWASHRQCIARYCQIESQSCIEALVNHLENK
jgi:hypothetical protein